MLYAKSTNGFYLPEFHGDRIPVDAVEITSEQYVTLLDGQSTGKQIVAGTDGFPVLTDPPAPTPNQIILSQIAELEATVTARRIREAVIGSDNGWLKALNDQCAALRKKLT